MTDDMMPHPTVAEVARSRWLVFFRTDETQEAIAERLALIQGATHKPLDLVDSLSWYDERFAACGGWDSWALEAVTGKNYRSREPYFHGFILTGEGCVGRGTAKVVSLALDLRKSVYWLSDGKLKPVANVEAAEDSWRILTRGTPL